MGKRRGGEREERGRRGIRKGKEEGKGEERGGRRGR